MKHILAALLSLTLTVSAFGVNLTGKIRYPDNSNVNGILEVRMTRSGVTNTCQGGRPVPTTASLVFLKNGIIQQANAIKNSEELDTSPWTLHLGGTGTASTITANAGIDPNGAMTAERIDFGSVPAGGASDFTGLLQNTTGLWGNQVLTDRTFTGSVWLRSDTPVTIQVSVQETTGGTNVGQFNTVSVTSTWQRFSATKAFSTTTALGIQLLIRNTQGQAAKSIYAWGGQMEENAAASIYVRSINGVPDLTPTDCTSPVWPYEVRLYDNTHNLLFRNDWYLASLAGAVIDVGTMFPAMMMQSSTGVVVVPKAVVQTPSGDQSVTQATGTSFSVIGPSSFNKKASTDVGHGFHIERTDVTASWDLLQQAGGGTTFAFQGADQFGTQNVFSATLSAGVNGQSAFTVNANSFSVGASTKIDMGDAMSTVPFKTGLVDPTGCNPKEEFFLNTTTTPSTLKVCNATGDGWTSVSGGSSAVTSVFGRTGDVVGLAGDYSSTTETLSNKTINCVTSNICIITTTVHIDAAGCNGTTATTSWDNKSTGGAGAICRGSTNLTYGVLTFPGSGGANTHATTKVIVPDDYDASGTLNVKIKWQVLGSQTGNVVWQVQTRCTGVGDVIDAAFNSASGGSTATAVQASGAEQITTLTNVTATGCTAGETLWLYLFRDKANGLDTSSATAEPYAVEVKFQRSI